MEEFEKNIEKSKIQERNYTVVAFILTVVVVVFIGFVLSFIPDKLDEEFILQNYIRPLKDFVAEKSETIQYIVMTISFPLLFIAFYKLINKIKLKTDEKSIKIIEWSSLILTLALAIKVFKANTFYLEKSILYGNFLLFSLLFLLVIALIFFYNKVKSEKNLKVFNAVIFTGISIFIGVIAFLYINHTYTQNTYIAHHATAYFYPIHKINCGLTPGVDFDSIYGYYSYFFCMIMKLFGRFDIYFFSFIVSGLIFIILGCFAVFINKVIKNKVIALIATLSVIYTLIIQHFFVTDGYYLQYVPHRVLFPALILVYMILYLNLREKGHKAFLELGGFIISAFAIFWNLDTGIIVLGVWVCFLGYEILFFGSLKDKNTYKEIGKVILMAIFSVLLYFVILNVITFARTGTIVKIKDIIFGQSTFLGSGFYMLKMPLWHPWILLVLVYGVALVISIKKLKFMNKNVDLKRYEKNSLIFSLAILGMGIFYYYQGRSHLYAFIFIVYPGIILLGMFLDYLINNYKKDLKRNIIMFIIAGTLVICGTSSIYCMFTNKGTMNMLNKEKIKEIDALGEMVEVTQNIKDVTEGKLEILIPYEGLIYERMNMQDTKGISAFEDLFTYEECRKVIKYLEKNDVSLYTVTDMYDMLNYKYHDEMENAIKDKYKIIKKDEYVMIVNQDNWKNIKKIEEVMKGAF